MSVEIMLSYAIGTVTGIWLSRTHWMTLGASRAYDIIMEAQQQVVDDMMRQVEDKDAAEEAKRQ